MVVAKRNDTTIEIEGLDDLYRVVKEVRAERAPLVLQLDDGDEVVINPAPLRGTRRRLTPEERAKADDEAFLEAAGSWKDHIDRDAFMEQVRRGRSSHRPLIEITLPDI